MTGQVNKEVPLFPATGSHLFTCTHHFSQVILCVSGSGGPDPLLEDISGSSSTLRLVNVFSNCKPLGRTGTFLLVPEKHQLPSFPFSNSYTYLKARGKHCLSLCCRWGLGFFKLLCLREDTIYLPFHPFWCCTSCSLSPGIPPLGSTVPQKGHTSCRTAGHLSGHWKEAPGTPHSPEPGGLHLLSSSQSASKPLP